LLPVTVTLLLLITLSLSPMSLVVSTPTVCVFTTSSVLFVLRVV
jgi:hypothetical protein